jgi:hypothetical protein
MDEPQDVFPEGRLCRTSDEEFNARFGKPLAFDRARTER